MNVLGKRIKNLREQKGVSQLELANFLNVANSTLSQYESGKRIPSDEVKNKIADYFNVSIDYLLGRDSITNNKQIDLYQAPLNKKDERDIEKAVARLTAGLESHEGFMLSGEILSEEAKQAIIESLASGIRYAKMINKKYTPKQYRKENIDKSNDD